jgi:hypothetical protein
LEKLRNGQKAMTQTTIRFLPAAALVALIAPWTVLGQSGATQVFRFLPTITRAQAQEIAIAISTITGMTTRDDFAKGVLSVQGTRDGTADQLKLGAWLFAGLNKSAPVAADAVVHEYRLADGTGDVVRLFYLDRGQTVEELREFVGMLRNIPDLPQAFTSNTIKALAVRGKPALMAWADWVVNEAGKTRPAPRPHSESPQYLMPADPGLAPNENVARIFYFANAPTLLDFQEASALIRVLADVKRAYTFNTAHAFAVRGTAAQLALAEWLFHELDQPAHPNPSHKSDVYNYRVPDPENGVAVRVFYLPNIQMIQEFDRIALSLSSAAKIRRVFTFSSQRAIAVRGTTDQVAATERLLAESDPADFPKAP